MQKPIFILCPGTDFTSCPAGMFPLRLRGAGKSRVKSYRQFRNREKRLKVGLGCNENIFLMFCLGFHFFFLFFFFPFRIWNWFMSRKTTLPPLLRMLTIECFWVNSAVKQTKHTDFMWMILIFLSIFFFFWGGRRDFYWGYTFLMSIIFFFAKSVSV